MLFLGSVWTDFFRDGNSKRVNCTRMYRASSELFSYSLMVEKTDSTRQEKTSRNLQTAHYTKRVSENQTEAPRGLIWPRLNRHSSADSAGSERKRSLLMYCKQPLQSYLNTRAIKSPDLSHRKTALKMALDAVPRRFWGQTGCSRI